MIRSPLSFDDESFPRLAQPSPVQCCIRDYAQILRSAVRRDRFGENGQSDVYSYMPRSTLRSLAANGQLARYSLIGYIVNGNSSNLAIRVALRRRDLDCI